MKPATHPDRVRLEAEAVNAIRDQLAALGQNEPDLLDISIESETGFAELVDELLEGDAEDDVMIAALKAREDDLKARRERFAKRKETRRALIQSGMDMAGLPKLERPLGTISLAARPASAIITDESVIPSQFWKRADPTLDKKGLTAALRERDKVVSSAMEISSEEERATALAAANAAHPEIPGATLSNGGASITIRRK